MVREYLDEEVPAESIERIVTAALKAPTAGHSQGVHLAVVSDPAVRRQLAEAAGERDWVARGYPAWLGTAPIHIALGVRVGDYRSRYAQPDKSSASSVDEWTVPYWWLDAGAALEAILLASVAEGLAAGFLGDHAIENLAGIVGWTDVAPAGLVTIGWAASTRAVGSAATIDDRPDRVTWIEE